MLEFVCMISTGVHRETRFFRYDYIALPLQMMCEPISTRNAS